MIGVVLWSDIDDQKAVFWCEDHGDLAYYDGTLDPTEETIPMNEGDMVEFDITLERKIRRAHKARLVEQRVCDGLQDHLRNTSVKKDKRESEGIISSTVVPFRRRA
ncbi:MAG: hypothetical protein ABJL67_21720 [Sulfitobacter sp.]